MSFISFMITPLSGAVIGYFTNWLAIKMLFRPHEEKRIFGLRVPFTPGLMPKERLLLSNKIGRTLADNVLTTDVIMETILKDERAIENILDKYLDKIMSEPLTVSDLINKIPAADGQFDLLYAKFGDMLVKKIESQFVIDKISGFISQVVIQLAKSEDAVMIAERLTDAIRPRLLEVAGKYLKKNTPDNDSDEIGLLGKMISEAIVERIKLLRAEESALSGIIPDRAVEICKQIIKDKLPKLAEAVKNLPYNNPKADAALRELTGKLVDENLGTVAGFFVNKDKIYSSLRFALFEYLSYHENIDELYVRAGDLIDKLLSRNLADIIPPEGDEQLQNSLSTIISKSISYNLVEKIITFVFDSTAKHLSSKNGESIDDMLRGFMPDYESRLRRYIDSLICEFVRSNARALVDSALTMLISGSAGMQGIRDFRIDKFLTSLGSDKLNGIKGTLSGLIKRMLEKGLKALFEDVDIAKITEEQINKLDISQTETLVISVVNRELKAITYLGGLLGLIIGFVPAVMNLFGM